MRQAHYPAELNRIPAHLTLFHTLPDTADVRNILAGASRHRPFKLEVTGLRFLGRGTAYTLSSEPLPLIHAELAHAFKDCLTAQDRQRFLPHVVVQNKVTPDRARALHSQLTRDFEPFKVQAIGLDLWRYLGGPWELAEQFSFSD